MSTRCAPWWPKCGAKSCPRPQHGANRPACAAANCTIAQFMHMQLPAGSRRTTHFLERSFLCFFSLRRFLLRLPSLPPPVSTSPAK